MDFSSQKVGNKFKKLLFRALELKVWRFGNADSKKALVHFMGTQKCAVRTFFAQRSVFTRSGTLLILIVALAITSTVESNYDFARTLTSLDVIPERVESNGWSHERESLLHDVDEDAVFQGFSKTNSAFLKTEDETSSSETPASQGDGETLNSTENTQSSDGVDAPDTTSETAHPLPPEESTEVDAPAPVPVDEPEPVSLQPSHVKDLSRSFYVFSDVADLLLPLANEVFDVPIDSMSVSDLQEGVSPVSTPVVDEVGTVEETQNANAPETNADESSAYEPEAVDEGELSTDSMLYTDFTLSPLESGQFIRNAQLHMSLGGFADVVEGEASPYMLIEYSFGDTWTEAGSVILDGEVSNALNGGYFLFALPPIQNVDELSDFKVRVSYQSDGDVRHEVYVDAVWLQLDTETFDKESFKERVSPDALSFLDKPMIETLLSNEIDFARTDTPQFSLRYESQRNFAIRFLRSIFSSSLADVAQVTFIHKELGPMSITPIIDVTPEGLITVRVRDEDKELLQPGTYTVELKIDEGGKIFTDTFEFQWGMLAINPNQTEYALGDTASIALGALSQNGNTVCDANLVLYIIDPEQYISQVPVAQSGVCNGNNIVDVPDYSALFAPSKVGTYEMYVERLDAEGNVLTHTSDTFKVVEKHALVISRTGPTRVYPPSLYPMQITVTSGDALTGVLTERVPADFEVYDTDAQISSRDGETILTWDISMSAGESKTFSYSFDTPDISPFLYTLGPASINDTAGTVAYAEPSSEMLATASVETDPITGEVITLPSEVTTEPDTVPVVTEEPIAPDTTTEDVPITPDDIPTQTFGESVIVPQDEIPTQTSEEVPSDTAMTPNATGTSPEQILETPVVVPSSESAVDASTTQEMSTSGTLFSEHRKWQIASDATGSMIVFWASTTTMPGAWTCISCTGTSTFMNRFPKGGATYGTTGGVATTTHTVDTAVNASDIALYPAVSENAGTTGADTTSHTHDTVTLAIGSTTTLPAYRSLRVYQHNNAGTPSTTPAGAIFMFDTTLPSGWSRYTPLDNRYPMGQNTIVSSSTNTHIHSLTGTTSAGGTTYVRSRGAGGGNPQSSPRPAIEAHTHTLSSSTIPASSEPPYIEVVFASSSVATATPMNAIAMWSDTPPAGWLDRSSSEGKPFYNRYIKAGTTYGAIGGSDTHTHTNMSATTSSSSASTLGRNTGSNSGVPSTHKHIVDFTNFTTASNTPPFVTVIIAKFYGYVPIYEQTAYRWYANANNQTPTDFWPAGIEDIDENTPIDESLIAVKNGDTIRLRIALDVSNSTTTGESFKLQFGTTTDLCTAITSWTDVGAPTSSVAWIGYDNNDVGATDGSTLGSTTITGTNKLESYEESNPTVALPNEIPYGQQGEWDFSLKQNNAEAGRNYCFRMVQSNGVELFSYVEYPKLVTNSAPNIPSLYKLFDNEKVASTTPWFEFDSIDSESNTLTYQIQIDDSNSFPSGFITIDDTSDAEPEAGVFRNLVTTGNKSPFNNGERIQYVPATALTSGVTYYWRVRAKDTSGSNTYGSWSEVRSLTIGAVSVSTWFQTAQGQFDTNTQAGTRTLVTDAVQLATGSTTGTTTSTQIDFLNGSVGNAWGSLAWTDTETSTNTIKYRLQYYDDVSASWSFIPDSALSGNSVGFGTSSISLVNLDVETYRIIRVLGIFTGGISNPKLSDWTVSWGYRINTPTLTSPFPSEKISTTSPRFTFTTTDPQGGDLVYEIQWSTTSAFTASTTKLSSTSVGFTNVTNGGDTSPFTSGNVIQYSIQPSDVLVQGRTYWWRVRAINPSGSQYSFYSDAQSFTVDTSVIASTWFQTTAEQFNTDTLSGVVIQSTTSATVASTSIETLIAYAEGTQTAPRYRVWNGTAWSTEANAQDVAAPQTWVVTRAAPRKNEYILATMGTDNDVNAQVYINGEWNISNLKEITASAPNSTMRGFDVAYENTSGDALVVACDGNADPTYYIWDGTSWTLGDTGIGLTGGNTCGWVKLISDPAVGSDEIIAITRDTGGIAYEARVWNGSAWGNSAVWGSMQAADANHEGIAAEYEESGNQAIVAVSNAGNTNFSWRQWNGASWVGAAATVAIGDDFEAGYLARDKGTDRMALCYIDQDKDIGVVRWDGGAWSAFAELYAPTWDNNTVSNPIFNDRPVDCAYENSGSRDGNIMAVYATSTGMAYQAYNYGSGTWSTAARASTFGISPRIQARRTGDDLIQVASYASTTDRYDYAYWNSTSATWSTLQTLETDGASGAVPFKEPLMIAPKNPVTTGTIVGNPAIDFYAGSGPYWQQMSWTDTENSGSSILYQVEYYDTTTGSWELVPNGLIPGNSVGTTTSPINLTNVLPVSTYRYIRPVANMTCNGVVCPILSDWTITWSAGITISGTAQQFNQSSNVTNGTPIAVAVNGVLQIGKTGTVASGAWTIANVNVSPGDIVTVFADGVGDTNEAVAVARYDGVGNMDGLKLFEQHVSLGSNDATTTPFTNAQIGLYDFSQDEDLFFDVSGTALDMCAEAGCMNSELFIGATSTWTPTGNAELNSVENNGTMVLGTNTVYVNRSWDNNGTTTANTSSVIFSATSTAETIDGTGSINNTFYNVTFGSTTATAIWTLVTALDANNNLSTLYGTLARANLSITIGGSLTNGANGLWTGVGTTTFDGSSVGTKNWSDSNPTLQNVGRVVIDGSSETVQLSQSVKAQSILIGADDILNASSFDITVLGDWINNNTFVAGTGGVTMSATTTNRTITVGGDAFNNLTFNGGGGSWFFTESALSIGNDFRVSTGTVTMPPNGTTTIAGSFSSVGGIFGHSNGTVYFTSLGAETIAASGTPFTNLFYNLTFNGSGSWSFLDTYATTSNNFNLQQGTVTFPSANLSVGGSFTQSGGTFNHNSGTVGFTGAGTYTIDVGASSFNSLAFTGSGSWSFIDTNVTAFGSVWVTGGTLTLPSGIFSIGGSYGNTATVNPNGGTVLFNSTDTGETISMGNSSLYNVTVSGVGGGWLINSSATTTNNFTLATSTSFTLASSTTLSVGGIFQNNVNGASTTWATSSTLSLEAGNYSINSKSAGGDAYGILRIKANTDIQMWNSTSSVYTIATSSSLYSQDHNAVDGDLYIFGEYVRSSGTEYWSTDNDFDGTPLTASTTRQVDVRFASGTTAVIGTSTLNIVGTSTATTTMANQGSGTYLVSVLRGTTTASYYSFTNLGPSGFTLASSTKVLGLSNGAFTLGVASGTAMTVSSSTINNATSSLQIYSVNFATTTAITGRNVTQNDGNPNLFWWFRNATGSISGEAFDNDTGDPGSIRWDNSSLSIIVSGTVYSDDGITKMGSPTCNGSSPNVKVVINGGSYATSTWCSALDGSYSITVAGIVGDVVLTTYLDTNGGQRGAVITKTPTGNITNHDIYANRIITKHQDVVPLSIADMAMYDSADDTDLRYTVATGTINTLTLLSNTELHIASSTSFNANGDITVRGNASSTSFDGSLHIDDNATFIGYATSTYTLGGSFTMDSGATFTPASTSVVMNATTTGKTITTLSPQEITFNTLSFTGAGGGWNVNGNIRSAQGIALATGTVTGTGNITITNGSFSGNGTLSMGSGTTTIEQTNTLGGTTPWTFGNLVLGNSLTLGTTTPASSATTTVLGKLTISTAHYLNAGNSLWNLAGTGNVFVENGNYIEATSTMRYSGAGTTNILNTVYYNLDLKAQGGSPTYTGTGIGITVTNNLTVGGPSNTTVNFDTSDPALDVNGSVFIESTGTLIGSATAVTTVAGNWNNAGVFTGSGGTVTFDGSGTSNISAGSSWFSNVTINGTGTYTLLQHATTTGAFTLTNVGSFTLSPNQSLAVGGTFAHNVNGALTTWANSTLFLYGGGNYTINASTTSDTYGTLRIASGTQIRMWNSDAGTYDVQSTGSLYSQDHANATGELYIYGAYTRASGNDYWSYGTDFDGNALGSPRIAKVYIASGSTVLYTGGGLAVLGIATGSTTIQNQGSGSYTFRIGGNASTTWSYYRIRNTDISGLTFSGSANVNSLSYGDYEVSQNSGTAITVGGTVLDVQVNTFTNNAFGTSGASPAYNVTATGTTGKSWRFTNHSGAIAGEVYDVDPGPASGDPGYLVWDNSSTSLSVSGTVFSGEGSGVSSACDGSSDIRLMVGGVTSYTTTCNGGTGAYSITGVTFTPGDSFIVYIDGKAVKAATVSEDAVSTISNFDLYENRVIVRHEGIDPLSIDDMGVWSGANDGDVPFTTTNGAPDTLTLPADRKLIVWNSMTFRPNGNVTVTGGGGGSAYDGTVQLFTSAVFDATGSETHTIGGSLISDTGASLDAETSSFVFTTSGASRTVDTNQNAFYNLTLNGSGSWSVSDSLMTVSNDFTITQGSVTLPTATTTVGGSFLNTGGSFTQNGGSMYFTASGAKSIRTGSSSFGTTTFNGSGSWTYQSTNSTSTGSFNILQGTVSASSGTLAVNGNFINNGTFTHNSGTLRLYASSSPRLLTLHGSDLGSTTFAGTGAYTMTDTNVALMGTLTIASGTLTLASGTVSIAGSFLNTGGSFNHSSGTILFNSSDTGEFINPGNSLFYNVSLASVLGGWTVTNNATTSGNFSLTSASSFTQSSSTRLTVNGVFTNYVGGTATTWTGSTLAINSGTGYTINTKSQGGDIYNNVIVGSSTALRAWASGGTITMSDTQSSFYSQNHASTSGALNIYGNYVRTTGADYWSYATDFDGVALGTSRQVYVYCASGASTTITGGALNIIGANGFDTTVSNQGSGTYGLSVTGGTLYALYYSLTNMGAKGLELSGATTVISSLTEGNFTLGVSGGSLITLSSSTLNYNAGLTISGASFATTTAITGYNINLIGTSSNAWTFAGHTGNFDGEYFDNDGATNCGSIWWDDSTCLLTRQSAYRWRNDDGGEGVPNSEWYDQNWTKRKRVTVTNSDPVSYANAVVKLTVTHEAGDMQSDFDDLRFTSADGTTLISHFRETYTADTQAVVWVKIPLLATSTDTDIYMYYKNGGASDASSESTFIFMDTFEDGSLSEYSGAKTDFTISGSSAYERTNRLVAVDPNNGKTTLGGMYNNNVTVQQGETLRILKYIDMTTGSADEICTEFGTQSQTQNYAVCLELFGTDRLSLAKNVLYRDTTGTVLASTTVTYTTGWYEIEVDWHLGGYTYVTLSQNGTVVATTSATDTNSPWTQGGVGFAMWSYHGGMDIYSARPLLTTDPTIAFGFEQVKDGASYKSALNTKASGVHIGDIMRPRFVIENTGLTVSDAYQLEFAPKGNAPSCESVSAVSFVPVPTQISCGATSTICMADTTHVSNGDLTTDVLGGEGTFVQGRVVENATNTATSITVNSSGYTEVEYAITPTIHTTDSNYCFRVSDNGMDIDSYVKTAEMEILFEPNITSVSLNGGSDIILLPGVTTTIYATGTASDMNGYTDLDINRATTTIYRSGVTDACTPDNNNCYISAGPSKCSFNNCNIGTNSCDISCRADFFYHADPTDALSPNSAETWRATLSIADMGGSIATGSAPSIDLQTTKAISVDSSISYPPLQVNTDSGSNDASTTVANIGNIAVDISIEGTDLTDGGSSYIPSTYQKFATSTFTYGGCGIGVCTSLSSTTPTNLKVDLAKPASTTPPITDQIFWGIAIPTGVAGKSHYGTNILYAITDTP